MAYYVPPSKKVGVTRLPCPPPNCAHGCIGVGSCVLDFEIGAHKPMMQLKERLWCPHFLQFYLGRKQQ